MTYVDYLSRNPPTLLTVNQNLVLTDDNEAESYSLMPSGWLMVQQSNDSETQESKEKLANN